MRKSIIVTLTCILVLICASSCKKPIYGCTNPAAQNYNPYATQDDGGCVAPSNPSCTTCGASTGQTSTTVWTDGPATTSFWISDSVTTNLVDSGVITYYLPVGSNPNCGDQGTWTTTSLPAGSYYLYAENSIYEYNGYFEVWANDCNILPLSQSETAGKKGKDLHSGRMIIHRTKKLKR